MRGGRNNAPRVRRLRRGLIALLGLALIAVTALRWAGVVEVPGEWLLAAWILDWLLALIELAVVLAAGRAFLSGVRRGGVLTGVEDWIEKERELGLPRPLVFLARAELRLYRTLARATGALARDHTPAAERETR